MCFGRIILPIETNESTIGTHNYIRIKNYLTCTKIDFEIKYVYIKKRYSYIPCSVDCCLHILT